MKSKTSFFNMEAPFFRLDGLWNRTLYVKNLTRFWPLWGLSSIGAALFPIAMILYVLRHPVHESPLDVTNLYYSVVAYVVPIILLTYSILVAMCVWGYLYQPKSVGLFHTLPIRREGLFVTSFLSGLTMVVIPCAATGLFAVLLSLLMHGFHAQGLIVTILAVGAEGFFYFASATAVAFITGSLSALPLLYAIFHFLAPLLDALLSLFSSSLIFGLETQNYTGVADFLSPTVYLMKRVSPHTVYQQIEGHNPDGSSYTVTEGRLLSVTLDNAWIIGAYALAGVALLLIAWAFYRLRRSECAGDVIAVGWGKPLFLTGVTFCSALGGGQLLYLMLWNGFDAQGSYTLIPLILCMIFSALMGYYIAAMLLAKSPHVFRGSLRNAGIVAVCCAIFCCGVYFDVLGVGRRIPDNSRIDHLYVNVAENSYYLYPGEDDALIEEIRNLQGAILADKDRLQDWRYDPPTDTEWHIATLNMTYYLKNGLSIHRFYPVSVTKDRITDPETLDYRLDQMVNGEAMKNKRLHAGDPRFVPTGGSIELNGTDRYFSLSSREIAQLLNALRQDTAAGAWNYEWFNDTAENRYAVDLNFSFETMDGLDKDWISVYLRPGMDATIQCLRDMGYLTDADLITWDALYALWDREEEAGEPMDRPASPITAKAFTADGGIEAADTDAADADRETSMENAAATPDTSTPDADTAETPDPAIGAAEGEG